MATARLELTFSIPILAKIEVNAANTADKSAKIIHIFSSNNNGIIFLAINKAQLAEQKALVLIIAHQVGENTYSDHVEEHFLYAYFDMASSTPLQMVYHR